MEAEVGSATGRCEVIGELKALSRADLLRIAKMMWPWDDDSDLSTDEELRRGIEAEAVRRVINQMKEEDASDAH